MKVFIAEDELWPHFIFSERGKEFNVDENIIDEYKTALNDFEKARLKLGKSIGYDWWGE